MRRTLTLAAVFLAAALTVFLGLELLGDHGADRSEPALEGAASPEREIDPELVGTGEVGEPQADEDPPGWRPRSCRC